jgi:hypothetical protein
MIAVAEAAAAADASVHDLGHASLIERDRFKAIRVPVRDSDLKIQELNEQLADMRHDLTLFGDTKEQLAAREVRLGGVQSPAPCLISTVAQEENACLKAELALLRQAQQAVTPAQSSGDRSHERFPAGAAAASESPFSGDRTAHELAAQQQLVAQLREQLVVVVRGFSGQKAMRWVPWLTCAPQEQQKKEGEVALALSQGRQIALQVQGQFLQTKVDLTKFPFLHQDGPVTRSFQIQALNHSTREEVRRLETDNRSLRSEVARYKFRTSSLLPFQLFPLCLIHRRGISGEGSDGQPIVRLNDEADAVYDQFATTRSN